MCKVHANNYHFTGRFTLSSPPHAPLCYFSSQVPTKDNLKHCEHWKDLSDESLTGSTASYETEGTHDGRRRNIERGMYDHAGACRCPVTYLTPLRCLNVGNCLFRVSNLYVSCDAIDICHVAFMNPLCLTDYTLLITMEVWGPEEMLLKIKGSGDVKVVSRVMRHQRLQLQPVMSARQAD